MYIYIYWIRSELFFVAIRAFFCFTKKKRKRNNGMDDDIFVVASFNESQCNSKLCRSEILIKAQTKEVWPFLTKLRVGERSFFFQVEIVETG